MRVVIYRKPSLAVIDNHCSWHCFSGEARDSAADTAWFVSDQGYPVQLIVQRVFPRAVFADEGNPNAGALPAYLYRHRMKRRWVVRDGWSGVEITMDVDVDAGMLVEDLIYHPAWQHGITQGVLLMRREAYLKPAMGLWPSVILHLVDHVRCLTHRYRSAVNVTEA